jgi:Glycosyl hydrolases family 2
MTPADWDITVAEVSEVEAKVLVRYRNDSGEPIVLRGTLRGPYCERAHTLPADFPFRQLSGEQPVAEAVVTDPCLWSEELPHLYRAEVEAVRGDATVAEYHGEIGLRRTSPTKNWDHIK